MQIGRALIVGAAILGLAGCSSGEWSTEALAREGDSPDPSLRGDDAPFGPVGDLRILEPPYSPRSHHTATSLPGGGILIVGGHDGVRFLATAEVYDPEEGTFRPTVHDMVHPRAYHTAVRVAGRDGRLDSADDVVLIVGGFDGETVLDTVEVYTPETNSFDHLVNRLPQPLHRHEAVRVPGPYDSYGERIDRVKTGNSILVVGGATEVPGGDVAVTNSAFLLTFDPEDWNSSICAIASPPSWARVGHTLTAFEGPDGNLGSMVLVYGGEGAPIGPDGSGIVDGDADYRILAEPEVYEVRRDSWIHLETEGTGATPRTDHRAVLLGRSRNEILIVGGFGGDGTTLMDFATIFRPDPKEIATSEFLSVPGSGTMRQSPEIALLSGGDVLVSGGFDGRNREILPTVEIFRPDGLGGFFLPGESMSGPRVHHSATRIPGRDEVILIGGRGTDPMPLRRAEAYRRARLQATP